MTHEQQLERMVQRFPGLAYRCRHDASWTLEFASDGSTELLGYTPDELVVQKVTSVADLIHPDDLATVSLEVERALTERRPFRLRYRVRARDGKEKWISEVGHGVFGADGALLALEGFLLDITEQVSAQQAVFADSRRDTVVRFAGGIAHDLNNMLTVVYTLTDALSSERVPPEQLREELGSLRVLGSSIAGLAKQLVGLGKGQGAARPVDLGQLVAASRPMLQNLAGKAVTVRVEATEGVVVNADATRLEQALMNLVINARDAVEGEGTVEIEVRSPAPGRATLRVTDDGAGIPPELRAKIFDPFFTTKATERGTGLGLMVVEQVAREIGGTVSVDSSPGKGTTFELHLPAINTSVPASTTVDEMGAEVVLLVDDDEAVRELVARGLRRLGYTVLESADGELALRLSERHKGPIDVLLTDGKIPRRSGPELAAAMRGHRPGIKQVLITGDQVIAPPELFDARIEKPCTASEVARVIRTVLRKT